MAPLLPAQPANGGCRHRQPLNIIVERQGRRPIENQVDDIMQGLVDNFDGWRALSRWSQALFIALRYCMPFHDE
jgi:hypothetical protein